MERWVLADTSALVGLFLKGDEWHKPAVQELEALRLTRRKLLTTTDIFSEVVTCLRKWGGYDRATAIGELLQRSTLVKMIGVDEELRSEGWKRFVKLRFPALSFADCTTFAVMDKFGIGDAFTFDDDFRKAGYRTLPGTR
jgi:predicted nucleic acid-binding protein